MKYFPKNSKGFTLVETMISVSLFVIIITIGMTALLNAHVIDTKSKDMRSIVDNLNFIMEDISRNVRVGSGYRCYSTLPLPNYPISDIETPQSCASGVAIAFEEASAGVPNNVADQWVYKIENGNIYKSTNGANSFVILNSEGEIVIDNFASFSVLGAEEPPPLGFCDMSNDCQQPLTIIRLSGKINYKSTQTPFELQTTVSQRFGDAP